MDTLRAPSRAIGCRGTVIVLSLLTLACPMEGQEPALESGNIRLDQAVVEIPLDLDTGRPMVDVTVNGSGPYRFILDTGSAGSLIDLGLAKELGLELGESDRVGPPLDPEAVEVRRVQPHVMTVGGMTIQEPDIMAFDFTIMGGGLTAGILGLSAFEGVLLTLDYSQQLATVRVDSLGPEDPLVVSYNATATGVRFDIEVNGERLPADLDTGSPSSFVLPETMMPELEFLSEPTVVGRARLAGGEYPVRQAQLDGVIRVAGVEYSNPQVQLASFVDGFANLGAQVIRDFVVTVDPRNERVQLEHGASSVDAPAQNGGPTAIRIGRGSGPRRVGIAFYGAPGGTLPVQDGGLAIREVISGSLAEAAGLRAGDVIQELNSTPIAAFDTTSLGAVLGGQEPLEFTVQRGDQELVVRIPS